MKFQRLIALTLVAIILSACFDSDKDRIDKDDDAPLASGLQSMQSGGVDRSYYLLLPEDNAAPASVQAAAVGDAEKPLIIGFHGSFGSHRAWVGPNPSYSFVDVVGDGAVMVFPDALELASGQINWNFEYDFGFFADLLDELDRRGLAFNRNKIFVVGHSSGGGMAHEVGCRFGEVVRAVGVSAGSLISGSCNGSVAVIQSQGTADTAVPYNIASVARNFWTLYNGWDVSMSTEGIVAQCVDHSLLPLGSSDYPVQWCEHAGGHAWSGYASEAFWQFFFGLPEVEPTEDAPPGGGNDRVLAAADTTMTFRLKFPDDIGNVTAGALTLYTDDYEEGQFRSPSIFLNPSWSPGQVAAGSEVLYNDVPITFFIFSGALDLSVSYILQISIYVEGGSQPIPTPCLDHKVLYEIRFVDESTPVVIGETLDVTKVVPFRGADDPPTSCESA